MNEIKIKRIFIGNLPPNVCENNLNTLLLPYGKKIGSIEIVRKLQGAIHCFAYVSMEITESSWILCKNTLSQSVFMSHRLRIEEAKPSYQILKILLNFKEKINLKKLSKKASKKNILELTYIFDDTLNQWINGVSDELKSDKNNIKIKDRCLSKKIKTNVFNTSKEFNTEFKDKKKNSLILDETFNNALKDNLNNEIKSNLLKESNLKHSFVSKIKKSVIDVKNLKSIFASKEILDSHNVKENNFYFFEDYDSDLENKKNIFCDKNININTNNIHKPAMQCFTTGNSMEFSLFFPHFDNPELHSMSAFSKVPNMFFQEIDNEEIKRNWINTRSEFTQNWKRKWKDIRKKKRKLIHKNNN
ncbi:hypothetical protein PMAC_001344 [Pneumocystis sp. 'macacae']|nr:hypothetical protein PMAC_001344 [Pneumocystis sp. 'macacae']